MRQLRELEYSLLLRCSEFDTSFWEVLRATRKALASSDQQLLAQRIFDALRFLFEEGLIYPFSRQDGQFLDWPGTTEEKLTRIQTEWDSLQNEPQPGEVVWLLATERGKQLADRLFQERGSSPI